MSGRDQRLPQVFDHVRRAPPCTWRSEFRNVLVGCVRRGVMTIDSAQRTAEDAEAQMREREYAVPSDLVLRAAAASRCSSYDCEFVVLAQQLGLPLVTADRQVLASFPEVARSIADHLRAR